MKSQFKELTLKYFDYLCSDFKFSLPAYEKDVFTEMIMYKGKSIAIKISYSLRETGVEVEIIKLVENKIPNYPILKNDPNQKYYSNLDKLIQDKDSSFVPNKPGVNEYLKNPSTLGKVLNEYSLLLKKFLKEKGPVDLP